MVLYQGKRVIVYSPLWLALCLPEDGVLVSFGADYFGKGAVRLVFVLLTCSKFSILTARPVHDKRLNILKGAII